METKVLKGDLIKDILFEEIKTEISKLSKKYNKLPGIAFIGWIGHQPLMKYTIGLHKMAANELGFNVINETLPANAEEEEMFNIIGKLNQNKDIHAIVLLQPVPKHINAITIIEQIDRDKEVEGFHPLNVMETLTKGIYSTKYPMCLPAALVELFQNMDVKIKQDQEFIFVVDEDFISNPFRNLILRTASSQVVPPDCSFTIVNNSNKKIIEHCMRADYLFIISEKPEFIQAEWLKPGVIIVDIYSNLVKEVPSKKSPNILMPIIRGGINTESVMNIAGVIAPCPGGLMPVLLAVLFRNALKAFKNSLITD